MMIAKLERAPKTTRQNKEPDTTSPHSMGTGLDKHFIQRSIVNNLLHIIFNISCEYPQRTFWLKNKKFNFCYAILNKILLK